MKRSWVSLLILLGVLVLCPALSIAATGGGGNGFPWDEPLTNIKDNAQNFIAPTLIVIAIIVTGFTLMYAGHGVGQRSFGLILGGSVALGVVAFMSALGWAGAIV